MSGILTPNPFQSVRQFAGPLDQDQIFATTALRNAYLLSPIRYAGQICSDLQDGNTYKLSLDQTAWTLYESAAQISTRITNAISAIPPAAAGLKGDTGLTGPIGNPGVAGATNAQITSSIQQQVNLWGNASFKGTAKPTDSIATPSSAAFYITTTAGTYTSFGGMIVTAGNFAILGYDGSAWNISQSSIDQRVSDLLNTVRLILPTTNLLPLIGGSKNLLDKSKIIIGQATGTDGSLVTASGWANFNPTSVNVSTQYTFSGTIAAQDTRVRFEDSSHTLISFIAATAVPITFTTPSNCAFVVLPAYEGDTSQVNFAQLELGTTATSYGAYTAAKISSQNIVIPTLVDITAKTASISLGKNLLDKSKIIIGQATGTDGSLVTASGWANFPAVVVNGSTQYTFNSAIAPIDTRVRYEDANHALISFVQVASNSSLPFTFTTPSTCAFVVLPAYQGTPSQVNFAQLELGTLATNFEVFGYKIGVPSLPSTIAFSPWYNYKITYFGDSITQALLYQAASDNIIKATSTSNGIGGSCVTYGTDNAQGDGVSRPSLCSRASTIAANNPDLIFVFAGTNDYHYSVPLGTISDTVNTTFFGGYKYMLQTLMSGNPSARIACASMLQRGTDRGQYSIQLGYVNAAKQVCAMYGIPFLNLFEVSGFNYENIMTLTTDATHPSTAYAKQLLGRQIGNFINLL